MCVSIVVVAQDTTKIDWLKMDPKGLSPAQLFEWNRAQKKFHKTSGYSSEIRSLIIQGNKIKTIVYNYGSISRPGLTPDIEDLVWHGLGYGYEFGPLVGAKVKDANSPGSTDSTEYKIVSEGFWASADGEYGPDGTKWGWLPEPGYAAPNQPDIASWGARAEVNNDLTHRPPSWPESWYNSTLGRYVWPAYLGSDATTPDEEVYFVVDDYTKKEFAYYPFAPIDSTKRGLGVRLECRLFQFQNALAQDIIFLVYTVENSSPRTLPNVYFGMFGDPHIGGANDYSDDRASFIPAREGTVFNNGQDLTYVNGVLTSQRSRNLVYAWDADGKGDIPGIVPGYFGYKFLESPTASHDGIDNDDDGIIDEDPFNDKGFYIDGVTVPLTTGIADVNKYKAMYGNPKPRWSGDENGNWDPTKDDVGIDGIPGTHDYGEGDGVPSQAFYFDANGNGVYDVGEPLSDTQLPGYAWAGSEPDFGFRDINESDQIGLRSFWALVFGGINRPKNDQLMYDKMSSDTSDVSLLYPPTTGDNIFLYGSGPFTLQPGNRQRFSIALLLGQNLSDLLLHSEASQRVLEANYRFAQPPPKPHVSAVAGDGRVTLYWDNSAEVGVDPLTNINDFEGYKIYRSEDYTFKDVFTITDANGIPFIGKPLFDSEAGKYAQWHLPWSDSLKSIFVDGFQPVEYPGYHVKYYLGDPSDNSGLRHQYVDSTVTNGKTYYYAVVSYDYGSFTNSLQLPPTESQATITRNPVTQELKFDVNTAMAKPGPEAAGLTTDVNDIDNGTTIHHNESGKATGKLSLVVLDKQQLGNSDYKLFFAKSGTNLTYTVFRQTPFSENITGRDTLVIALQHQNIVPSSLAITDANGTQVPSHYIVVDSATGQIHANTTGKLLTNAPYTVTYQYYPVVNSTLLNNEDGNPVFDGIRPFVKDDPLAIDTASSGFITTGTNIQGVAKNSSVGIPTLAPFDVEIRFSSLDTVAGGKYANPVDSFSTSANLSIKAKTPFHINNATDTTTLNALIVDGNKNKQWDFGEAIIILTPPPYKKAATSAMMEIDFNKSTDATKQPVIHGGETFVGKMKKPFTVNDTLTFSTQKISYNQQLANSELDKVIVVPNPYVEVSTFEQPGTTPTSRGNRVIQFRNLPTECTIRIYTLTGELVRTLYKNDTTGFLDWDVLSSESARIGYGVYIYQIETPTGGTRIGRLAIIK